MPRRWISMRGSKRQNGTYDEQENADFNFVFKPVEPPTDAPNLAPSSPALAYRADGQRPQSSGGLEKRKSKPMHIPETIQIRPQTSENKSPPPFGHGSSGSKTPSPDVYDMIGLAYGSPTHPPTNFYQAIDCIPPVVFDHHAFEQCGPFSEEQIQASKSRWRKFGFLFKQKPSKSHPAPNEPFYKAKLEPAYTIKSTPQQETQLTDSPHDSPITLHNFPAPPRTSSRKPPDNVHEADLSTTEKSASLPKLHVEIPTAKMDRYTLMFGNVQATESSSSLLERRNKVLDQLRANAGYAPRGPSGLPPISTEDPNLLVTPRTIARRQTSPTFPSEQAAYSLYPRASDAARYLPGAHPNSSTDLMMAGSKGQMSRGNPLRRSMTSPARMSPLRDTFDAVIKPPPLRVRKLSESKILMSPQQSTASTDQTVIWSADAFLSPSSSTPTVDDDILFDVKSFRDSQGMDGIQFEMTRPSSDAVELYRTMSHNHKAGVPKAKSSRLKNEVLNDLPKDVQNEVRQVVLKDIGTPDTEFDPDDSQTIDETIAAVERLATPASSRNTSPAVKMHIGQLVDSSPKAEAKKVKQVRIISPTPSPLPAVDIKTRIATPEISSAVAPPPVPVKDSKFIPVSKYATKPSSRPARPVRSKTESSTILPSQAKSQAVIPRPVRSVTESSPLSTAKSKYNTALQEASRSDESLAVGASAQNFKPTRVAHLKPIFGPTQSRSASPGTIPLPASVEKSAVVTVPAVIQAAPVAEVSVARTVSLSRKESRRVLVTPGLTQKRREAREKEQKVDKRRIRGDEWDVEEEKRKTRMELKNLDDRKFSPVVREVDRGHRIGKSVNALIESI